MAGTCSILCGQHAPVFGDIAVEAGCAVAGQRATVVEKRAGGALQLTETAVLGDPARKSRRDIGDLKAQYLLVVGGADVAGGAVGYAAGIGVSLIVSIGRWIPAQPRGMGEPFRLVANVRCQIANVLVASIHEEASTRNGDESSPWSERITIPQAYFGEAGGPVLDAWVAWVLGIQDRCEKHGRLGCEEGRVRQGAGKFVGQVLAQGVAGPAAAFDIAIDLNGLGGIDEIGDVAGARVVDRAIEHPVAERGRERGRFRAGVGGSCSQQRAHEAAGDGADIEVDAAYDLEGVGDDERLREQAVAQERGFLTHRSPHIVADGAALERVGAASDALQRRDPRGAEICAHLCVDHDVGQVQSLTASRAWGAVAHAIQRRVVAERIWRVVSEVDCPGLVIKGAQRFL